MKKITGFQIYYSQYLDHSGSLVEALPDELDSPERLCELYAAMVSARHFDQQAINLQRTGQLGTYSSPLGQEAIGVGTGHAMYSDDVLLPSYRETSAQFARGVRPREILLYWGGDERGMCYADCPEDFPISVPIASQATHAAGVASAFQYRQQQRAAVCCIGDGGTSKGDFYEALNLAGAWQLPLVFVVSNNQWAISVPRSAQSGCETLAQKAIAGGIPGEQVDGNDVIAVYAAVRRAVDRARNGEGGSLIEALTYRMSDHTTADDASRYRDAETHAQQQQYDPVTRLHSYLVSQAYWDDAQQQELLSACKTQVDDEIAAYLDLAKQPPSSLFDYLYQELPSSLEEQRQDAGNRGQQ